MVMSSTVHYERSAVSGVELEDLDQSALQEYIERRAPFLLGDKSAEQVAARFGLVASSGGRTLPTVAGLVLFGSHPQLLNPEWGMVAVRIRGTKIADPLEERADLEGPLPELLRQGLAFTSEHTQTVANLVDPEDAEPEYPETAVREALLNALVHRDYRLSGRVTLRIYDDRLEVWSPGGMPVQLSLEHLAQHGGVSFPRNPVLAAAARSMGLLDQIGRGLPTIRKAMAEVSSHPAQFGVSPSDFLVALPSRLHTKVSPEGEN